MTDNLTPDGGTDQLEGRLRALHTDTDGMILAESSSVRRRGDRRRRMTQAGTVLGVAVLAVGVVGVAGTLNNRPAAAPPAATSPDPSASAAATVVAADPFLRARDVAPIGPYASFVPGEEGTGQMTLRCLSEPASWGATSIKSLRFFSDLDATFVQTVLQFSDEASAQAAALQPRVDFAGCPGDSEDGAVADRSQDLGVGSQSYQLSRLKTPTGDAGLSYTEVAVARNGTVVVVLDWSSLGSPVDAPGWAWTPEQIGIALNRAVD